MSVKNPRLQGFSECERDLLRKGGARQRADVFFSAEKKTEQSELCSDVVRQMGLEPIRSSHTHLKRACLPIPALPRKN